MKLSNAFPTARTPLPWILLAGLSLLLLENLLGIPPEIEWGIFGVVVILWGIPHGAIDHVVAARRQRTMGKPFSSLRFFTVYIASIGAILLLWWIFPLWSLLAFLLVSGYHFGETDLHALLRAERGRPLIYGLHGTTFLLAMLVPNPELTIEIIQSLNPEEAIKFSAYLQDYGTWAFVGVGLGAMAGSVYLLKEKATIWPLLLLYTFLPVIWNLPLPLAFALYFGGVHSLHAFLDIHQFLKGEHLQFPFQKVLKAALPLSLVAVPGTLFVAWLGTMFWNPVMLIFVFISALTIPHVQVMRRMYLPANNGNSSQ